MAETVDLKEVQFNGFNRFFPPVFPLDLPENIRKPLLYWYFLGDSKGTLGKKRLNIKLKYPQTQQASRRVLRNIYHCTKK